MRTLLLLVCFGLLLAIGCTQPPAAPIDLSMPQFVKKPVIWLEDWEGSETAPDAAPQRVQAKLLAKKADALKSKQDYPAAEKSYRQAIEADPTWPYPTYQLACNYELAGDKAIAFQHFLKAIELGFDDFPTALFDHELGSIRQRKIFKQQLAKIREHYLTSAASKVGQPIAVRPQGEKPAGGWPVIFLLHGYGDSNLSYLDHAELWTRSGFVAVALPGSIPTGNGFIWDPNSFDHTHSDIQAIINSTVLSSEIDPQRVYLHGFSQGALHAVRLTVDHPDQYAGLVAVSPGGPEDMGPIVEPKLPHGTRSLRCVLIHGEQESLQRMIADAWKPACEEAKWEFKVLPHPGGHHFPQDWLEVQPEVARFLNGMQEQQSSSQ